MLSVWDRGVEVHGPHGPAVWVYRWREGSPQGISARKSMVIGTTEKYPTRAQAVEGSRRTPAEGEPREVGKQANRFSGR